MFNEGVIALKPVDGFHSYFIRDRNEFYYGFGVCDFTEADLAGTGGATHRRLIMTRAMFDSWRKDVEHDYGGLDITKDARAAGEFMCRISCLEDFEAGR